MDDMAEERADASGGEYYVVDNEHHTVTRGSDHKKLDLTPEIRLALESAENHTRFFDQIYNRLEHDG